jgi:stress response protein SCP2
VIELRRGDEMALAREDGTPLGKLTMGVGWDKKSGAGALSGANRPDVDLDASAIQYAGDQLFDLAFFNHLETRDGSVVHQGDNISGRGEGDDEQITIDLATVFPRVDAMLFLVSSFMLAKIFRDPDHAEGWRLRAIGQGIAVSVPTESLELLQRFL